jgi:hypothetical protein
MAVGHFSVVLFRVFAAIASAVSGKLTKQKIEDIE